MKANVQYNDLTGTVAADIADEFVNSLDEYLSIKSKLFSKAKFHCIGCELRPYNMETLDVEFYCRDLKTGQIVPMRFNQPFKLSELFEMFKRVVVVLGENIEDVETPQAETVYLD